MQEQPDCPECSQAGVVGLCYIVALTHVTWPNHCKKVICVPKGIEWNKEVGLPLVLLPGFFLRRVFRISDKKCSHVVFRQMSLLCKSFHFMSLLSHCGVYGFKRLPHHMAGKSQLDYFFQLGPHLKKFGFQSTYCLCFAW